MKILRNGALLSSLSRDAVLINFGHARILYPRDPRTTNILNVMYSGGHLIEFSIFGVLVSRLPPNIGYFIFKSLV